MSTSRQGLLEPELIRTLFGIPGAAVMHVLNELKNQRAARPGPEVTNTTPMRPETRA